MMKQEHPTFKSNKTDRSFGKEYRARIQKSYEHYSIDDQHVSEAKRKQAIDLFMDSIQDLPKKADFFGILNTISKHDLAGFGVYKRLVEEYFSYRHEIGKDITPQQAICTAARVINQRQQKLEKKYAPFFKDTELWAAWHSIDFSNIPHRQQGISLVEENIVDKISRGLLNLAPLRQTLMQEEPVSAAISAKILATKELPSEKMQMVALGGLGEILAGNRFYPSGISHEEARSLYLSNKSFNKHPIPKPEQHPEKMGPTPPASLATTINQAKSTDSIKPIDASPAEHNAPTPTNTALMHIHTIQRRDGAYIVHEGKLTNDAMAPRDHGAAPSPAKALGLSSFQGQIIITNLKLFKERVAQDGLLLEIMNPTGELIQHGAMKQLETFHHSTKGTLITPPQTPLKPQPSAHQR